MMGKFLGILILLIWFAIVMGEAWSKKVSFIVNVFFGVSVFLLMGCFYCVPFWLIFMR